MNRVYVLGGWQTDFARNFQREGHEIFDVIRETALEALGRTGLEPAEVDTAHVGNFTAELFCRQGHLGGLLAAAHPDFAGLPIGRHEAACASGRSSRRPGPRSRSRRPARADTPSAGRACHCTTASNVDRDRA